MVQGIDTFTTNIWQFTIPGNRWVDSGKNWKCVGRSKCNQQIGILAFFLPPPFNTATKFSPPPVDLWPFGSRENTPPPQGRTWGRPSLKINSAPSLTPWKKLWIMTSPTGSDNENGPFCYFSDICGSPPGVMMADTLSFNAKIGVVDFWV